MFACLLLFIYFIIIILLFFYGCKFKKRSVVGVRSPLRNVHMLVIKQAASHHKDNKSSKKLEQGEGRAGDDAHLHDAVVEELHSKNVLGNPASVPHTLFVLQTSLQELLVLCLINPFYKNRIFSFLWLL